jgi:outer membrane immunogenic protein
MRNLLLSTVAVMAMTGSALAADLPSTKAPAQYYAAAPVFSWTGFYVGVEGGGDFRQYKDNFAGYTIDKDAGLIGGLIGYNWQLNSLVFGLEGDAAALLGGNKAFTPSGTPIYNNTFNSNYAAAIRGRLGWAAFDRTLIYVAGGVAFGDTKVSYATLALPSASYTTSRTGYTIGVGVDYAWTNNWIGRLEYRYVDLGTGGYYNYGAFVNDGVKASSSEILAAIIYKFGTPETAAVVAKY